MIIPYESIQEELLKNVKGGEGEVGMKTYQDAQNKIMRCSLKPGAQIGLHTHETNSEIIYVLSGTGKVLCDGVWETLKPGTCHYCPQGHAHSTVNDGTENLETFAIIGEHGAN